MKNFIPFLAALIVLFTLGTQCSGSVPVKELTDARAELAKAEKEAAAIHDAADFDAAQKSLIDAHTHLSEEKTKEAAASAVKAYETAVKARLMASPLYTEETKASAQKSISDAERAMAESFSAAEYNAAISLFNEAKVNHEKGLTDKEALPKEDPAAQTEPAVMIKKQEVLSSLETAYTKYNQVNTTATAAKTRSLARSGEMTANAGRIEAKLREAQSMGAQQSASDSYNKAMTDLNAAKSKIASGDLKEASALLKNAENLADAAHATAQQNYAVKLQEQAKAALNAAKKAVNDKKTTAPVNEENTGLFAKLTEFLSAGDEGLTSADTNYKNRRYDNSIKDSNEVLNLSKIITADLNKVSTAKTDVAVRDTLIPVDQSASDAEKARLAREAAEATAKADAAKAEGDQNAGLPEGWFFYVVKAPNSLWRIAKFPEIYGRGAHWTKIYKANKDQIKNPNRIYPGQKLKIPPKEVQSGTVAPVKK
jgi:hypothetical protein